MAKKGMMPMTKGKGGLGTKGKKGKGNADAGNAIQGFLPISKKGK